MSHWIASLRRALRGALRDYAGRKRGRAAALYVRLCKPNGHEYAEFLRPRLHGMGPDCSIQAHAAITDPALLRMGRNVRLSGCKLFGHDGSVNMINKSYGLRLDSVGAIDIGDNVFIGEDAIVLGPVRIGSNVIIAAGSVVTRDVESGWVVGGIPARRICRIEEHVERLKQRNAQWPWRSLIEERDGEFDPALESRLERLRAAYFFADRERDEGAVPSAYTPNVASP